MNGGIGNDVLTGGNGRDIQVGGVGVDRFDFNLIGETKVGALRDRLNDFKHGQGDKIDLSGIDAKTGIAGNQAFTFIGDDAFSDTKGELRFKDLGAKVIVQGDVNGNGTADFEIFVNIGSLVKGDFIL
jgi:Ca2+-binding RTX toxin-like protein